MNTNRVVLKDNVDANRVKEEYEYLGWNVQREGQTLTLSKRSAKKNDKKRNDKPAGQSNRDSTERDKGSDDRRASSNKSGDRSRTTHRS